MCYGNIRAEKITHFMILSIVVNDQTLMNVLCVGPLDIMYISMFTEIL